MGFCVDGIQARVVVGDYRQEYNQVRPHNRLGHGHRCRRRRFPQPRGGFIQLSVEINGGGRGRMFGLGKASSLHQHGGVNPDHGFGAQTAANVNPPNMAPRWRWATLAGDLQ